MSKRPRRLKEGDEFVLFQHFRLIRTLGRGNFAYVHQVRRLADGQDYALKHIDISAVPPDEHGDLVNEIRLMAAVEHPNLVTYREAWVERGQLFVVVELASGGDLGTLLGKLDRRREGLPETHVWRYFLQLATGLQYLHHNRVLHRDVKPENVLLAEGGLLKIADLGVSQVLDHVFTRVLMGTPQYVAPEAWRGKPYSYSADVWALGCVLHELCTRRPLFLPRGRPSDKEICARVLEGRITPISRKYSPDLWELIKRLLAKNPAARPTMDEVMQMEMVRARLHLLPSEVRARLEAPQQRHVALPSLFRISAEPAKWPQLNAVLPPAKYAVGQGVAQSLCAPRAASCPDLLQLAALAQAGAPQGAAAQARQPSDAPGLGAAAAAAAGEREGRKGDSGIGPNSLSGLFSFSAAYPETGGWVLSQGLRRASTGVPPAAPPVQQPAQQKQQAQQQQQSQQQQQHGAPPAPTASQAVEASEAAAQRLPLQRCRSLSDLLRAKPFPESAVTRSHWALLWGFDPSPLEFGSPRRSPAGRRSIGRPGHTLAECAASSYGGTSSYGGSIHGGASFYEASYHGGGRRGGGSSSYGGSYAGSYQGSYHGGGKYYESSYHSGSYAGSYGGGSYRGGSYHGGSYYGGSYHGGGAYFEGPSGRGGFESVRAAAAKHAKQAQQAPPPDSHGGKAAGGAGGKKRRGLGAKLKRLLFGKHGT